MSEIIPNFDNDNIIAIGKCIKFVPINTNMKLW